MKVRVVMYQNERGHYLTVCPEFDVVRCSGTPQKAFELIKKTIEAILYDESEPIEYEVMFLD